LSLQRRTNLSSISGTDAAALDDVLCGLRHQQLFQLHLLHQLQRQIDQLVVTGALLQGSREVSQPSVAASASRFTSGPSPTAATSSSGHVTQSASPPTSAMTSHVSAMMDMSCKQQLGQRPAAPSTDGLYSHYGFDTIRPLMPWLHVKLNC